MTRSYATLQGTLLAFLTLVCLLAVPGCSGNVPVDTSDTGKAVLPPLPSAADELRMGTALDNDTALGNAYLDSHNVTDDGTIARVISPAPPSTDLAWAMYQIAARPAPETPYMLTVTAFYSDQDPVTVGSDEGYYIAYGDYNKNGWVVSGPYYKSVVRLPFAPSADVVSPGDNVYAAVIASSGTAAFVVSVEVGYDIGPGWEEHILSPTQGDVAGMNCDIAVDPAGNPQIVYIHTDSMMIGDEGDIYIAKKSGDQWDVERVGTSYPARVVQLALGSGGRRALLVEDTDLNDFHLLWDGDGSGFGMDLPVDPANISGVIPSVAFCNGGDSPTGDLDTAVVVYAVADVAPNIKVCFVRFDGGVPLSGVIMAGTRQVRAIDLYTDEAHHVRVAFPIAPAYPSWDLHFSAYSAALNAWAPASPPDWVGVDIGTGYDELIVRACQPSPTEFAATYILHDFGGLQTGLSSGGAFGTKPEDRDYCALVDQDFETQAYSDGTVAHLVQGGNFTLGMCRGRPDSGTPWEFQQITTEALGCARASFVVDVEDTTHVAVLNPHYGRLEYYSIDKFGAKTNSIVDTGGGEPGMAFGRVPVASTGSDMYVFYSDSARMRILYSRCHDGIWQEEGVPLNAPEAFPYMLYGAGYLENEDLLYVAYLDFYDMSICVLSCPPGENNWTRTEFGPGYSEIAEVGDDESEVAVCYAMENPIVDNCIYFAKGDPRAGPGLPEVVTTSLSEITFPWYLDYSPSDGHWGLLVQGDGNEKVLYFERGGDGIWGHPEVVVQTSGVGAFYRCSGLVHDNTDGTARVLIENGAVGPLPYNIDVYRELSSGGFDKEATVTTVDPAAVDSDLSYAVESADGLPFVIVPTQAPATPWDFEIFAPDGGGAWGSETVWHTWIEHMLDETFGYRGGLDPSGMPVVTVTEMNPDSDYFGIACVYQYW